MNFAVHVQQPGGQKRYGLVLTVMINPPELPINEKAWNDAHIATIDVPLYWRTPRVDTSKAKLESNDA